MIATCHLAAIHRHGAPPGTPEPEGVSPLLCRGVSSLYCAYKECRRKIEMSPGVQSRNDTPVGGRTRPARHCIRAKGRIGIELPSSVTGQAEAGSAGEQ